jgi:uncharacterized Zn-binding protein involved in type VI secretion
MAMRTNIFGKSQIIRGDKTSHGGVVISGSPTSDWHGIPIARKGDRVYCPICPPHNFVIAEGLEQCSDHGLPWALEGHKTTCGAVLIAQTAPMGADAALALSKGIKPTDTGDPQSPTRFDPHFVVHDKHTGQPVSGFSYGLKTAVGEHHGALYEDGATAKAYAQDAQDLALSYLVQTTIGIRP